MGLGTALGRNIGDALGGGLGAGGDTAGGDAVTANSFQNIIGRMSITVDEDAVLVPNTYQNIKGRMRSVIVST